MTFDEWLDEKGLLEIYDDVEWAKDAWNAALLQAMEAVDNQPPKTHDSLINKSQALLSIARLDALCT